MKVTPTPTSDAADLAARLRNACTSVRSKSYPLADLIPLMQQAADALASTPAQPAAQQGVAYAALPEKYYLAGGEVPTWDAKQMHAFADATHTLRASHGQAPASVLHLVHSAFAEIAMAFPKAFALHKVGIADTAVREALAAPATAQAADSVQEDAARLDWLEQNLFHREMDEWDVKFGGRGDQNMWVLFAPKGVQGSARRIIDAARKQGANHDR